MDVGQSATIEDGFPVEAIDAKLALFMVENPASTDQEFANKLGVCRQTVNKRKNSPPVQKIVRSMLKMPEKEMRRVAAKALARMEGLLDHEDPRIKLEAASRLVKLTTRFMGNDLSLDLWDK